MHIMFLVIILNIYMIKQEGKFKFLFRIEDSLKPIQKSLENFNSSWFESYFVKSQTLNLFYLLTQDDEFRYLKR